MIRPLQIVAFLIMLSTLNIGLGGCKSGGKAAGGDGECGECLDIETAQVCTPDGTMRNACMAICREKLILCRQACPCPEKHSNGPAGK